MNKWVKLFKNQIILRPKFTIEDITNLRTFKEIDIVLLLSTRTIFESVQKILKQVPYLIN